MSQSGAQVAGAAGAGRGAWLGWFLGSLALVAALLVFVVMLSRARTQDDRIAALDQQVALKGEELAQAQRKSEADTRKLSDSQMQVDSLTRSLTLERSERAKVSGELDQLRAQKAENDAAAARLKDLVAAMAITQRERDAARAEVERLSVSKSALEEQVSALTARVQAQAGTIASLEERLREALAERDRLLAGAQVTGAPSTWSTAIVQQAGATGTSTTMTASTTSTTSGTSAAGRGHSTAVFSRAGATDDGPDPNPLTNFRNQMLLQEAGAGPRPMVISRVRGLEPDTSAYAPGVAPSPVVGAVAGEVAAVSQGQTRLSSVGSNTAQSAVGALGIVPDAIGNFFTMIGEGLDSAFTGRTYVRPGATTPEPAPERAPVRAPAPTAPATWGVGDAHGG